MKDGAEDTVSIFSNAKVGGFYLFGSLIFYNADNSTYLWFYVVLVANRHFYVNTNDKAIGVAVWEIGIAFYK